MLFFYYIRVNWAKYKKGAKLFCFAIIFAWIEQNIKNKCAKLSCFAITFAWIEQNIKKCAKLFFFAITFAWIEQKKCAKLSVLLLIARDLNKIWNMCKIVCFLYYIRVNWEKKTEHFFLFCYYNCVNWAKYFFKKKEPVQNCSVWLLHSR